MEKYIMLALAMALLFSFVVASLAWAAEDKEYTLQQLFYDADIKNDGQIDRIEFDIFHSQSFVLLDTNHDEFLTLNECTGGCFQQKIWLNRKKIRNSAMAETIRKYEFITSPYRFDLIDKNNNKKVSLEEYIAYGRKRFQYFDHDQNGFISASEFCSSYHASTFCDF